jgi:hypothetical protein
VKGTKTQTNEKEGKESKNPERKCKRKKNDGEI